ncbi:MAG: hypothetical protein KTR31_11755 [Myxococcales bacterium]|nr:hypothetical protein [Myxococcales bacterium]
MMLATVALWATGCSGEITTQDWRNPPLATPPAFVPTDTGDEPDPGFRCTQVIGYSQVGQTRGGWYTTDDAFESEVEDDRWQLLWSSGGGVDLWQDPDYTGWSLQVLSRCADAADSPDRVLLSVSGPYGDDEVAWADAIDATIATIEDKLPTVEQIVLQPVVGGPAHAGCDSGAGLIRASWQHAHIDAAIDAVVGDSVVAGMSPEVRSCEDYRDSLGHLTEEAAQAIGAEIGTFYAQLDLIE